MPLNKHEAFALDQVFHTYPSLSFDEIKALCLDDTKREEFNDAMEKDDRELEILELCEEYADEWWSNIPEILDCLVAHTKKHFGESI